MVNPGTFRGLRKEFLQGEKATYSAGVTGGYAADALAVIQRRYFKRFPVDLPLDEDPTPESLASVDDETVEDEPSLPDKDSCTQEEYDAQMQSFEERGKLVALRKAQLKRWFAYQYMKDQNIDAKESGLEGPYRILLKKLSGISGRRPKQNTGTNVWRRGCREEIETEAMKRLAVKHNANKKKDLASIREAVVKERFAALTDDEKQMWKDLAKQEYEEIVAQWEKDIREPPKEDAASRQQCIQALPDFVQPILDGICAATGWKCTLIAGGPEPAHEGRLNMIGVHSGTTKGDVKMNFGRAERLRWKSHVVEVYGDFLKKCYSPEDCRLSALPQEEGFRPMAELELEQSGVNVNAIESRPATRHATPASVQQATPATRQAIFADKVEPSPVEPSVSRPEEREESSTSQDPPPATCATAPTDPEITSSASDEPEPCASNSPDAPPANPPTSTSPFSNTHPGSPPPSCNAPPSPPCRPDSPPPSRAASPAASLSPSRLQSPPLESAAPSTSKSPLAAPTSPAKRSSDDVEDDEATQPPRQKRRLLPEPTLPGKRGHDELNPEESPSDNESTRPNLRQTSKRVCRTSTRLSRSASTTTTTPPCSARTLEARRPSERPKKKGNITPDDAEPTPSPSLVASPPTWFTKSLGMFKSLQLEGAWDLLLKDWEAFECRHSYTGGVLPSTRRPNIIAMWIGRRRSVTWRPQAADLKNIEADFNAWWKCLQPGWRVVDKKVDKTSFEGDWASLNCPGVNGFQSVIAGLFFWKTVIKDSDTDAHQRWLSAVEDCRQVLLHM